MNSNNTNARRATGQPTYHFILASTIHNSGPGWAGSHLIKFQVSQVTRENTREIRVESGFGYFRVFAHSTNNMNARRAIGQPKYHLNSHNYIVASTKHIKTCH